MSGVYKKALLVIGTIICTILITFVCFAETSNFKINRTRVYGDLFEDVYTSAGNQYWRIYPKKYTFTISDSNQNQVDIKEDKTITMKQDNDYYYFDVNINIKNENISYNGGLSFENGEYQRMGNSSLYLSNTKQSNIEYNYNVSVGEGRYLDSSSPYYTFVGNRTDKIELKIGEYNSNQQMSIKDNEPTDSNTIYTKTDVVNTNNCTSLLYNSLKFPFEDYLSGTTFILPFDKYGTGYTFEYIYSRALINFKGKILFTHGQSDFTSPKKLPYECISSISCSHDIVQSYFNESIKANIKIKKDDINNYRYLNLYNREAVSKSKTSGYMTQTHTIDSTGTKYTFTYPLSTYTASSVHSSEPIDLLDYIECNHNWTNLYSANKEQHEVYCTKCEWNKMEDHNLEYEYDGILHNACKCGYIDKVHYTFEVNDDNNNTITETFNSYSNYNKEIIPTKKGYKFKWFAKYEKQLVDEFNTEWSETDTPIRTVFIATCSNITDKTDKYSTIYKCVYEPIHWTFKYSNKNKEDLVLIGRLEDQVFEYGTSQKIQNHIKVESYGFKGWSLISTSSEVDFAPNEEIINYTATDNNIYVLYPVYDLLKYKIVYSTTVGQFSNGLKVLSKDYSILSSDNLEYPQYNDEETYNDGNKRIITSYKFKNYTDIDNKVQDINKIREIVKEKGIYNYVIYLKANYIKSDKRENISQGNKGGGGGGGSNAPKEGDIKNIIVDPSVPIVPNDEIGKKTSEIYNPNESENIAESEINENEAAIKLIESSKVNSSSKMSSEEKKIIEKNFEPEVAEYIMTNKEAYDEVKEAIDEELGIQGMSMSKTDEFYYKYGVKIATTSYFVNYHLYKKQETSKIQKAMFFIEDRKIVFIPLFIIIFAGIGFYYYKVYKYKTKK